jgi:PTS system ascorbate-specific IIA component
MVHLVIVAHAPLASALQRVAQHAYPESVDRVRALDVERSDRPEEVESRLRAVMPQRGDTLLLTDVVGATPCNVSLRVAEGARVRVVAGVNVPMVWRALCYGDVPLGDLVDMVVSGGTHGIMQLASTRPQNQAITGPQDDSDNAHHQQ